MPSRTTIVPAAKSPRRLFSLETSVLIAETSCEQGNDFLDRALVVRTVAGLGAEFFPDVT